MNERDHRSRNRTAIVANTHEEARFHADELGITDGVLVSLSAHPGAYVGMRFDVVHRFVHDPLPANAANVLAIVAHGEVMARCTSATS